MNSGKTLYPMMGVGAFNIMFWLGFIVGHDIGLSCWGMFFNAFLFGSLGTYGIIKLEGNERGESRARQLETDQELESQNYDSKPKILAIEA